MVFSNPVFHKEVLTKMRGRQSKQVLVTVSTVVGLFVLWCYYEALVWLIRYGGSNSGRDGWAAAAIIQMVLIWILSPALTANAISQEREQQTWEMLLFTRLTPPEIVLGKLFARLVPMVAILGAFFPFMVFCFARSADLSPGEFFATYAVFGVWVMFLSITGLFMSWTFKRTPSAIATSYLVVFALLIGTALINMTISAGGSWQETWIIWLNPVRIAAALLDMKRDTNATAIILFSSVAFSALAGFLLWRMIARFRELSVE